MELIYFYFLALITFAIIVIGACLLRKDKRIVNKNHTNLVLKNIISFGDDDKYLTIQIQNNNDTDSIVNLFSQKQNINNGLKITCMEKDYYSVVKSLISKPFICDQLRIITTKAAFNYFENGIECANEDRHGASFCSMFYPLYYFDPTQYQSSQIDIRNKIKIFINLNSSFNFTIPKNESFTFIFKVDESGFDSYNLANVAPLQKSEDFVSLSIENLSDKKQEATIFDAEFKNENIKIKSAGYLNYDQLLKSSKYKHIDFCNMKLASKDASNLNHDIITGSSNTIRTQNYLSVYDNHPEVRNIPITMSTAHSFKFTVNPNSKIIILFEISKS